MLAELFRVVVFIAGAAALLATVFLIGLSQDSAPDRRSSIGSQDDFRG